MYVCMEILYACMYVIIDVCMYICIYVLMYVCIYIRVYLYFDIYNMYINLCMCVCKYVSLFIYCSIVHSVAYIYICTSIHTYIYCILKVSIRKVMKAVHRQAITYLLYIHIFAHSTHDVTLVSVQFPYTSAHKYV